MAKSITKDMTSGSPLKLIIGFAFPMFLGMLFQQLYSMVDTVIVGKLLGMHALAGVGSTGSLNFMVIGFCMGICSGFAVPISQMFGAKHDSEMRKYVANSTWLSIFFSVVITVVVAVYCRKILTLLNTPEDIFEYAYTYILIIFLGIPCTILYNMLAAIIRSLGDSTTPVLFLALSSAINIVLDIVFIVVFHMNVEGPAWATVISQGVSGVICLFYMRKKYAVLKISKEEWKPSFLHIKRLCQMGIPMGLQYSITAIGTLVIQAAVNGLGSVVVAGVTAAQKIMNFMGCPIEAIGTTMGTYSAQNMGAGKVDRISKGTLQSSLCGFVMSGILLVVIILTGRWLPTLFLDVPDPTVIEYAYRFLVTTASGYCLLTLVNTVRFSIQGMGFSFLAIFSGVLEMLARTLVGLLVVPVIGYTGICFAHVTAWIAADLFLIPAFFACKKKVEKNFMK